MTSTPSRTVLILGAHGRLGSAAAEAFWSAGWRVVAQARRGELAIQLSDTDGLARAAAGASVVVYGVNPPYTDWDAQLLPLARAGMDVAQRLGALFMLPGNVYNFGAQMPALLNEHTPERPTTPKGRLRQRLEAELAARAEPAAGGLRSVVLRAGDFYGHGSGNWFDQMIVKKLAQGRLAYPGPADVPHAWAYLPDLARAFVAVAERSLQGPLGPTGHTRLQFAGHTFTGAQLLGGLERAAQSLGVPAAAGGLRRSRMRWAPVRLAGLFVPMLRELATMRYLWTVPHALDGRALQALVGGLVGELAATPPDQALRSALAALGHGKPAGQPRAIRGAGPALSSAP
jgi:dTDP-4-dehydrorhamnose reductase